jgi:hypothetical protein
MNICITQGSDWVDSTSELTSILRSTEVVLFCAVPNDQAANNVGGYQRGRSRASDDRTPARGPYRNTIVRLGLRIPWLFSASLSLPLAVRLRRWQSAPKNDTRSVCDVYRRCRRWLT